MFRRILPLFALFAITPAVALADQVGAAGHVSELEIYDTSADAYLAFHGRVFVGDKKSESEYRWGGTSCGTKMLSEHHVSLLMRAFDSGFRIEPHYQTGQGTVQCLVGFSVLQ